LTQDLASAAVGGESESVGPKRGLTLAETTTTEVGMHSMIKTKMKRRRGAFQGQCADYVSHKAGGKSNKLCGKTISGHPMYGGGEQNAQCSKQYGSGGGELNSEGEGTGIVPFPYQGGYGSCSYQGFFTYTSSDHDSGRTTCRKACDRVQHCKYFAHNSEVGSGFNTNYCTLFNSCQTWAKTNAGWPGGLLVPMFKCKPGCTGTTCSADAGWVDLGDQDHRHQQSDPMHSRVRESI